MTLGHMDAARPFRPTMKGGGSKKGKGWDKWPWVIVVVAEAITTQAKGSIEAWRKDRRRPFSLPVFEARVERMLPGVWKVARDRMKKKRVTPLPVLLWNRVYKMHYNGTSARGKNHDPKTRDGESSEYWTNKVPVDSPLRAIYEQVLRGQITHVENWEQYL